MEDFENWAKRLDCDYPQDGDQRLADAIAGGLDLCLTHGESNETLLHIACRRRRLSAVKVLVEAGSNLNQENGHGKTAYAHSIRRGFTEISDYLASAGANTALNYADQFAVAITNGSLDDGKAILEKQPSVIQTGNPEEDRLLADLAGRELSYDKVDFLINAGADIEAKGLDGGTAVSQAAWFAQPKNLKRLIQAGANLDRFDNDHFSSTIGWVTHGSRYSGGAQQNQAAYQEMVLAILENGCSLEYPAEILAMGTPSRSFFDRLLEDATPDVRQILKQHVS